jgi:hypothetical protein
MFNNLGRVVGSQPAMRAVVYIIQMNVLLLPACTSAGLIPVCSTLHQLLMLMLLVLCRSPGRHNPAAAAT